MDKSYISVILPQVSDEGRLAGWLDNVFSQGVDVEVLICDRIDPERLASLGEDILAKVKVFPAQDKAVALKKAISDAQGGYILFSDVGITYADDAFAALLARGVCVFNGDRKSVV